jgi:glycosyltransferase involved in cell wall biosynthesis
MFRRVSIIIVITGLNSGGAEAMLVKLLGQIDKTKFNLEVISLTTRGDKGGTISDLGIPVFEMNFDKSLSSIFKIFYLINHIKKKNPDIVHTWMYHSDLIGGLCAYLAGVKRIVWGIRQSNLSGDYSRLSTILVVKICSFLSHYIPTSILVCSHNARKVHEGLGYDSKRMLVIQNGFDLNIFKKNEYYFKLFRQENGIRNDATVIGMIARFDPQKNHIGFIQVISAVVREINNILFVFVGEGVDYNNTILMNEINRFHLKDKVLLLGKRSDINYILNGLDVLVLPSLFGEGFPNVIGEAMACEVPCLATNLGDCFEILGNENFIADPADMTNFYQKLISLCLLDKDEKINLGKSLRQRIVDNYEISYITRLYQKFYFNILED